jgi:hypothetical protein
MTIKEKNKMKKKTNNFKSQCCQAPVVLKDSTPREEGSTIVVTMYFVCKKCNKPCNIIFPVRKVWDINPKTKVKNSKKNQTKKPTKKEIERLIEE